MSHVLRNKNGMSVSILPLGGIIQCLTAPDRDGRYDDVVLGFDAATDYENGHPCFGALIGRYGNRISAGRFTIDGHKYVVACNDGENHLHGGYRGFDKVNWSIDQPAESHGQSVRLRYISADGEEGFPGELSATILYALGDDDAFRIDYKATSTRPTPINLTSHPYFNLAGQGGGSILGHELEIPAATYTPVGADLIPIGTIDAVEGTPMDFRNAMPIGTRIDSPFRQLQLAGGYDHNWVLDNQEGALKLAARVIEPGSGRVMEVLTTEPGIQFYSANALGNIPGKAGAVYGPRSGFCLETQHYPDSPNRPNFPSTILRPGELYESTTIYRFTTIAAG